jgi:hypothetical protein
VNIVKEKEGKPDRKAYPLPYGLRKIHTKTSSLKNLKIMRRQLNEIALYVHEFGFRTD